MKAWNCLESSKALFNTKTEKVLLALTTGFYALNSSFCSLQTGLGTCTAGLHSLRNGCSHPPNRLSHSPTGCHTLIATERKHQECLPARGGEADTRPPPPKPPGPLPKLCCCCICGPGPLPPNTVCCCCCAMRWKRGGMLSRWPMLAAGKRKTCC